jgi:ATP-dependent protease ClpP protease subunit
LKYVVVLFMLAVTTLAFSATQGKNKVITLSDTNTLVLDEEVSDDSVARLIARIQTLNSSILDYKPIYLFLRSPGGSISAGLELIEFAQTSKRPIHTISAFSASMSFQIAQNLGQRYVLSSAVVMSHRAAGGIQGSFGGLSPSQLDNRYALWLQRIKELDLQTVRRTNGKQTYESYIKAYADELWLTGPVAVEQGYADEIVGVSCDDTMSGTIPKQANFMGFKIDYEVNKCPVSSGILNAHVNGATTEEFANLILQKFRQVNKLWTGLKQ